jgi:hypothetical protein
MPWEYLISATLLGKSVALFTSLVRLASPYSHAQRKPSSVSYCVGGEVASVLTAALLVFDSEKAPVFLVLLRDILGG